MSVSSHEVVKTVRRALNGARHESSAFIRIYVNDHRAGAAGGVALARRSRDSNLGTALGDELTAIVGELEVDAATLEAIATCLSVDDDPIKRAVARVGEIVGRLKANGRLISYSPLSRLLEIELLMAGIDAKRSLWRSLSATGADSLREFDFDELERRASDQRARLVSFHLEAARDAFLDREK